MRDCKVGERVEFLGGVKKTYLGDTQHPIPFWPQKSFEDEYHALPIVQEYETRVFGKPYKEWLAETQS